MEAVILVGGLGTRLRPVTNDIPKPMIAVAGRPFLVHQLELIRRRGIGAALLLVGYRGDQIRNELGAGGGRLPDLAYAVDDPPMGTLGALVHAVDGLPESFLLLNGDTYLDLDFGRVVAAADERRADAMVVAASRGAAPRNLRVDHRRTVVAYQKEGLPDGTHVDAGATALRRSVVERFSELVGQGRASLEHDMLPVLAREGGLLAYPTSEPYFDIGTPEGIQALERHLT